MNPAQGPFRLNGNGSPHHDHEVISDLLGLPAQLVQETLAPYSLRALADMTEQELKEVGLTPAKARKLRSAFELGRRFLTCDRVLRGKTFQSPRQIFEAYQLRFRDEKREHFMVLTLDARHRVMAEHVISVGFLSQSIVHPREVFRVAVKEAAGAIVVVHNHPSGDPSPSDEDVQVTRRLVHAGDLIGIRILDHIVIGDGKYSSFRETGLL